MSTDHEPAVRVANLTKRYRVYQRGERPTTTVEAVLRLLRGRTTPNMLDALHDVSFDAAWGDVVGVIGRNGAGKSTLLKILTRITAPSRGRVELGGRVGSLLEVGTGFHPELTGRENVYLNGTLLGMRRREIAGRFDDIVEFAGVAPYLDTQVKRFSTGMYIRLAFAVAAHLNSEILVVDEVLAVGDAEFQEKCLRKMREVALGGRCVFLVSHQVQTVTALATRALYLDRGKLAFDGSVAGALAVYRDSFERVGGNDAIEAAARPGSGAVRLANVRTLKDSFDAAEEKVLEFSTLASQGTKGRFHLCCDIRDENRVVVARCDSRLVEFWIDPREEAHGTLTLRTPWLSAGVYTVDCTVTGAQVADRWEGACSFRVLPILPYPGAAPEGALGEAPVLSDFFYELK